MESHKTRRATQLFTFRDLLTSHCGEELTPDNIDFICLEFEKEIHNGPSSWAFPPNMDKYDTGWSAACNDIKGMIDEMNQR